MGEGAEGYPSGVPKGGGKGPHALGAILGGAEIDLI